MTKLGHFSTDSRHNFRFYQFRLFAEFDVFHDFLRSEEGEESRVRRRGQSGVFHYSLSSRKHTAGQLVETRTQLTPRDYDRMLASSSPK